MTWKFGLVALVAGCAARQGVGTPTELEVQLPGDGACGVASFLSRAVSPDDPDAPTTPLAWSRRSIATGCQVSTTFHFGPNRTERLDVPAPGARRGALRRRVRSGVITRRVLELRPPQRLADPWKIPAEDVSVQAGQTGLHKLDLAARWYLVVSISDTPRSGGASFPFPVFGDVAPAAVMATRPRWCAELASYVQIFEAEGNEAGGAFRSGKSAVAPLTVSCATTHTHVVAFDLGQRRPVDVRVNLPNRIPLVVRVVPGQDVMTLLDVPVQPLQ